MLQPAPALFLQPHYDDVALSCGGTAAAFALAGQAPRIVTVFASEIVDAMVGAFAAWKHERWGLRDPDDVLAARRAEDAAAAAVMGCEVRWLGLPDAIYRGERYACDDELYGRLHEEEAALAEHLAEELMHLPEWRPGNLVFVPVGAGSHVDHQLVFETGRVLARRGATVWAYEDSPYAIHTPAGVRDRLDQVGHALGEEATMPIPATLQHKLDAIACYGSQVPVIFRFTDDFRAAVAGHAWSAGDGSQPAERFWRVAGPRQG
jgi:LmbE family N-acetylglucosaminyl deacetylase